MYTVEVKGEIYCQVNNRQGKDPDGGRRVAFDYTEFLKKRVSGLIEIRKDRELIHKEVGFGHPLKESLLSA